MDKGIKSRLKSVVVVVLSIATYCAVMISWNPLKDIDRSLTVGIIVIGLVILTSTIITGFILWIINGPDNDGPSQFY